jgi:hypothetical protein
VLDIETGQPFFSSGETKPDHGGDSMKKYLFLFIALLGSNCLAQVTVELTSPAASATVAAPLQLQASASSSYPITGWHAYLDGVNVYSAGSTQTISTSVSAARGTHQLVIRAWNSTGAYGDKTVQISVGTAGGSSISTSTTSALPTPPSTARLFNNIDQMMSGWGSCETASCAGGSGSGSFWQAFNQTAPSMDGSSMELFHDGVWGNALWWRKVGANNNVTNFLWDFYVQLDAASLSNAQALEYDAFQFVGGYNYMIGTECNYAAGVWDTWSEASGKWLHTTIPCKKFAAGSWHHVQWYITTNHANHSYTYVTLVVDGTAYNLNQMQYAKYLGWADNLGVQWQLDVNASGNGYHEWVDKATLAVW